MKKFVAVLLATALISSAFSGCGNPSANGSSSAATSLSQKTTLHIMHYMGEDTKRSGLKNWTNGFTEKNANITFSIQELPSLQFKSTLQVKISSGDAPDIIMGKPHDNSELIESGQIMDLTGQPFLKIFNKEAISASTLNGKVYGVPVDSMAIGVFYNKDLFKKYNATVPKTYNDFLKVMKTFSDQGQIPFARPFKDANNPALDLLSTLTPLIFKYNSTDMFTQIQSGKKKFSDYPMIQTAFTQFADRLSVKSGDDLGTDTAACLMQFASGKYPMLIDGSWATGDIVKDNPNGNFGFFATPTSNVESENTMYEAVDDSWMVSAQTKGKDAVIRFLSYISTPERASEWAATTKCITVIPVTNSETLSGPAKDISDILKSGRVANYDRLTGFSGEAGTKFSQDVQMFVSLKDRNVQKFIAQLDNDFKNIAQ